METWKPVIGYEGIYEVSNLGTVKSVNREISRNGRPAMLTGVVLSTSKATGGYDYTTLYCGQRKGNKKVARLVLEAFVGPCPIGMECCHNNGNLSDNRLSNLRWDTHKNNMADKKAHGTQTFGETTPAAILNEQQVDGIIDLLKNTALSQDVIGERFGVCASNVSAINTGATWSHKCQSYPIRVRDVREDAKKPIPNKVTNEMLDKIVSLRKNGYSQAKIANIIGVCQTTVSKQLAKRV